MDNRRLDRSILTLAIPNILSNITVPLLGIADLALAGRLDDADAIGGIAIATTIFNLIYWNFSFLRMGTTGMTAQAKGAGDRQAIGRLLAQSLFIALIFGGLILLLRAPISQGAMSILSPEAELVTHSLKYFDIVVLAAPAVLLTYALNGWIIGMQNTWLPMAVSLTTNILNIAISAYLVLVAKWDISGIATGTLVAHYAGVVMLSLGAYFLYLHKGAAILPHRPVAGMLIGVGRFFSTNIYIFLRTSLLILVTVFFTYAGTRMGGLMLSTNTLLLQFFTIFSYFTDGFAYAGEALVGLHYGRRDRLLVRRVVSRLMLWGGGIALLSTVVYAMSGNAFLRMLTDKPDLVANAAPYMIWVYLVPVAGFAAFLWDGIFIGLTAAREMLWSMLLAVLIFFAIYYGIDTEDPNHALWGAFIAYLVMRGVVQFILSRRMVGIGRDFPHVYYLSLATTVTTPGHLDTIVRLIKEAWRNAEVSEAYTTPDATGRSDTLYTNAVVRVSSHASPFDMDARAKALEARMGRTRIPGAPILLDLDVVVCDDEVLRPRDYERDYFVRGYERLRETLPG